MKLTTSQFRPLHEIYIQHTFISHPHTQLTHTHPLPKTLIFTFHLTFDIVPHFPLPIAPHSTYQTRVHCCANLGFDMCTVQPHNVPISTVARILHSKCSSFAPTYTVHPLPKTLMFTFHLTFHIVPQFPLPIAPHSTYKPYFSHTPFPHQTRVHCCTHLGFDMCTIQPHNVPISTVARILHSKCSSFAPTYRVHPRIPFPKP